MPKEKMIGLHNKPHSGDSPYAYAEYKCQCGCRDFHVFKTARYIGREVVHVFEIKCVNCEAVLEI